MFKFVPRAIVLSLVALAGSLVIGCTKPYLPANTPIPSTAPPADKARVYFIKPGGSMGSANAYILREDKVIGYLENRKVFLVELPAGIPELCVDRAGFVGERQVHVEAAAAGSLQQRLLHQEDILHQLAFTEFVQEAFLHPYLRIYWDSDATARLAPGQLKSRTPLSTAQGLRSASA